ncbi:MAG: Adenylate cyclase [Candidatus Ozemobacter sibiricus]|uniref:Adenylate cyclase n=1 Tax=Candidatus Ozemobacter sibiricus TaxID=2268124 RepID=A0A367ZSU6_9BACT|nr:MAG: Adenylate cyclase [Candidatus Ozemobacter sibiricus]
MTGASPGRLDLRFKIFLFHLLLVFVVMAGMTAVELSRDRAEDQRQREVKTQTLLKTLEAVVIPLILQRDIPQLEAVVRRLTSPDIPGNDIIGARITDARADEMAYSRQTPGGGPLQDGETPPALRICPPGGTEAVGFLHLTFSTAEARARRSAIIAGNLALALVASGLAFLWSWGLAFLVTRPLQVLATAVEAASPEQLRPAPEVAGQDEIAVLVAAFNRMTQAVNLHLDELRRKNAELDRRVYELSTLHQAGRAINSVLNPDQLYECIVDTTISVLGGVKRCSLMLVDRRTDEFIVKIAKGLDVGQLPPSRRVPIVNGVAGKVYATGEPKIVNDLAQDDDARTLAAAPVVRSSLCYPIKNNEEVIGVISASNKINGEPFTARDLSLMETLAMQASIAIKNARLYQDLNRKILELNTLHEVGKSLNMVLDLEKLLEMIIDMTSRVLGGVRSSSLMLFDEDSGLLQVKVHRGIQPGTPLKGVAIGEGIAGKVFQRGEPMMINNPVGEAAAGDGGPRSSLCVPLKVKDHPVGVLSVSDKLSGESFDENDLSMLMTLASQIAITVNNAQLYEDLEASYLSAVRALANSLDAKDAYTRGHSERVALYSLEIGRVMNLDAEHLKTLQIGALLHDIGKIGISETIIQKATRLTEEEYQLIKTHPVRGAAIIEPAKFLKEKVPLIKYHHERYDGKGYPEGLKGEAIPLMARIICVADSYDAMTSKRAYRDTLDPKAAAQELLRCSGTQFDPKVVAAFLEVLADEKKMQAIERYRSA